VTLKLAQTSVANSRPSVPYVANFSTQYLKNRAKITKLDTDVVHREFLKPIYFGIKRSKVKVPSHKKTIAGAGLGALVSAGFL